MSDLSHIAIDEDKGTADCSVCKQGVTAPPSFGGIPRSNMLSAFLIQHAVHTKAGAAAGLTATGKPSKAARTYLMGPDA